MASGTLSEATTVPSGSFSENLFLNLPTDARFKQVVTHKFVPRTGLDLDSTQIEFVLNSLDSPNCYFIHQTMIEVQVLITKANGTVPAATAQVCPNANMLSSLFETVSLRINDVLITASGSHYGYKDYVQTLLTAPYDAKQLATSKGFILDLPPDETGIENNDAYSLRTAYFRAGRTSNGAFKADGATFIGKLSKDKL